MPDSGVAEYIHAFKHSRHLGRQIVYAHCDQTRRPEYGHLKRPLARSLERLLAGMGISRLYSHQVRAIDLVRDGKNVVVATPTASGKSLVYNLPVIERVLTDPDIRALYLFPLKALAQDQMKTFRQMISPLSSDARPSCAIYDGDTPARHREKIRRKPPNCLFTNPDMLHLSLLPYHRSWSKLWRNLAFVVIDEVHTYRGIMGSNMGWVFRRLKRICRKYGSNLQRNTW